SAGLPEAKKRFPAPEGWYAMGILIDARFRRSGIARFLSDSRIETLKELGAKEYYSIVDRKNQTSIHMHRRFGFEEIEKGPGFLHIEFESGSGILFRKTIRAAKETR
ncbi:MAG: GNAT family N-acetyltransferase, partial [Bdellovibrionota bacterium]